MGTFVLVHGGWDGGWAWTPVVRKLQQHGHEAYAPTLTGCGERAHLASRSVNLDTYITDVVNVIRYELLENVTLVGSSSGGMVITGVAERIPERIAQLIYLDAMVPLDGENIYDIVGNEFMGSMAQMAQEQGDGWRVPFWVPNADRRTCVSLVVCNQPIKLSDRVAKAIPRTFVQFTGKVEESRLEPVFRRMAERVQALGGWRYLERPWVHYPCLDMEGGVDLVTGLLMELVGLDGLETVAL